MWESRGLRKLAYRVKTPAETSEGVEVIEDVLNEIEKADEDKRKARHTTA